MPKERGGVFPGTFSSSPLLLLLLLLLRQRALAAATPSCPDSGKQKSLVPDHCPTRRLTLSFGCTSNSIQFHAASSCNFPPSRLNSRSMRRCAAHPYCIQHRIQFEIVRSGDLAPLWPFSPNATLEDDHDADGDDGGAEEESLLISNHISVTLSNLPRRLRRRRRISCNFLRPALRCRRRSERALKNHRLAIWGRTDRSRIGKWVRPRAGLSAWPNPLPLLFGVINGVIIPCRNYSSGAACPPEPCPAFYPRWAASEASFAFPLRLSLPLRRPRRRGARDNDGGPELHPAGGGGRDGWMTVCTSAVRGHRRRRRLCCAT